MCIWNVWTVSSNPLEKGSSRAAGRCVWARCPRTLVLSWFDVDRKVRSHISLYGSSWALYAGRVRSGYLLGHFDSDPFLGAAFRSLFVERRYALYFRRFRASDHMDIAVSMLLLGRFYRKTCC